MSSTYLFYNWKFVPFDPLHPFCPLYLSELYLAPSILSQMANVYGWKVYIHMCVCGGALFFLTHYFFSLSINDMDFFIQIIEHLGCFHALAIIKVLKWTWGCGYLFKLADLLNHLVDLFLIFRGPSMLFSMVTLLIYIVIKTMQRFPFLHVLTNTQPF